MRRRVIYVTTTCAFYRSDVPVVQCRGATEVVLHLFPAPLKGAGPASVLTRDAAGNFYGTTGGGGAGQGTVFEMSPNGRTTVIYSFKGGADGAAPAAGVVLDAAGNIYGTTGAGGMRQCAGRGRGVVFKIDTAGHESVLYSFMGGVDGVRSYSWSNSRFGR